MTVELDSRCGNNLAIKQVSECEILSFITEPDLHLKGELVQRFP